MNLLLVAIRTTYSLSDAWPIYECREASHAMLAYLDPSSELEFDPPPPTDPQLHTRRATGNVQRSIAAVELGSGTGFVAARVAAWLRPDLDLLVATDLPEVCPLLETNLRSCAAVRVRPLPWGSREHASAIMEEMSLLSPGQASRQITHVLCSDLVCL